MIHKSSTNPYCDEKDNPNTADSCLAKVYLYILEIGFSPEADPIPDVDDPRDEEVEK